MLEYTPTQADLDWLLECLILSDAKALNAHINLDKQFNEVFGDNY